MSKFTIIVLFSILLFGIIITFLCTLPTDPSEDYSNTDIIITSDSSSALTSLATSFSIKLSFPNLIDSVVINYDDNALPVKIHIKNNDSLMASQTNNSLTFKTNHTFLTDGEKTVDAIAYMSNLTKSSNIKLNVFKQAQFIPDSLIHVTGTLTLNAPISLSVNATGTLPLHFSWYKNAIAIPASDNAVYTIPSFQITDTGSYFCVVSNTKGIDTCVIYKIQISMILYTIQYNGNGNTGGIVPLDTTKYTSGSNIIIRPNTGLLTKNSATFTGWNTRADGTGTNYSEDANLLMGNANIVLFARWTSNPTFTITYNGNGSTGGTVPVDGYSYETGITVTIKSNSGSLAKTGFIFSGWSINPDGTGASYTGGESITIGVSNIVLYAKWTSNPTFTITYSGNGNTSGTAPIDATTYETGTKIIIQTNTGNLAKTGYTFAGWNTDSSGKGSDRTPESTFVIGSTNVLLYAKWTINQYTITYDPNGGTFDTVPTPIKQNYKTIFTVTAQGELSRDHYKFAGWDTKADSNGERYHIGDTFTIVDSNVTLFAVWAPERYIITCDALGATNPANKEIVYPVVTAGTLPTPVFTGCNFKGWWTTPFDTGTQVVATTPIGADIKVYARWTVTDINGNEYKTVKIGNQTWMAQNLRTTRYNDGDSIENWDGVDDTKGKFIQGNSVYGAIYNAFTLDTEKLAPKGWRIPSETDWQELIDTVKNNAKSLASTQYWATSTRQGSVGNNLAQNNSTGFNATPGGTCWITSTIFFKDSVTIFWSLPFKCTNNKCWGTAFYLSYSDNTIREELDRYGAYGCSIRLLRNNN